MKLGPLPEDAIGVTINGLYYTKEKYEATFVQKETKMDKPLRVWWISQVPMKPFHVPVRNLREAALILDTLAKYDISIKPDYSNMGGLEEYQTEYEEWWEWEDIDEASSTYCDNIDKYIEVHPELLEVEK